jgi:hypothetical protein
MAELPPPDQKTAALNEPTLEHQLGDAEKQYVESLKAHNEAKEAATASQAKCLDCLQKMSLLQRQFMLAANQQLAATNQQLLQQVKELKASRADNVTR